MGTGGPVVADHLGYVNGYLEASDTEQARMRQELQSMPLDADPRSRLRYAILISLRATDPEPLGRSLALLDELRDAEELTPAERWLARLWSGELASRVELGRENEDVRVALEQARRKIEQLTMIEEQLEADDDGSGERQ